MGIEPTCLWWCKVVFNCQPHASSLEELGVVLYGLNARQKDFDDIRILSIFTQRIELIV